ncbi:hypothetical protein, partial [Anaerophilus nitritogenes]|uniref:hypothetical protein n=1 Tax=Anaerophilus nitritogenes TaxID=2498136 RepID=UPI001A9AA750
LAINLFACHFLCCLVFKGQSLILSHRCFDDLIILAFFVERVNTFFKKVRINFLFMGHTLT